MKARPGMELSGLQCGVQIFSSMLTHYRQTHIRSSDLNVGNNHREISEVNDRA